VAVPVSGRLSDEAANGSSVEGHAIEHHFVGHQLTREPEFRLNTEGSFKVKIAERPARPEVRYVVSGTHEQLGASGVR
jgi:hypothetical protein